MCFGVGCGVGKPENALRRRKLHWRVSRNERAFNAGKRLFKPEWTAVVRSVKAGRSESSIARRHPARHGAKDVVQYQSLAVRA